MPDDRDRNRPKHPPLHTDDWDDATPRAVDVQHRSTPTASPSEYPTPRSNPRAGTQPGAQPDRASARAALRKITELDEKFDEHSRLDKEALDGIHATLREHSGTLGDLRENTAASTATLEAIKDELGHVRQFQLVKVENEAKVQLVRVEGETRLGLATIQQKGVLAGWRAKVAMAAIGAVGGALGALLKWLLG